MNESTPPVPNATLILDRAAIERCLKRLAHEIIERNPDLATVALAGIPSRGVHMAQRLAELIGQFENVTLFAGAVDVSMHRDDISARRRLIPIQATSLPHELEDKTIVLVDDVLFSGRTVRAAMDAIMDLGRPRSVQLAVIVDRGHRELPVRADFVGKNVPTSKKEIIGVRVKEIDHEDCVVIKEMEG